MHLKCIWYFAITVLLMCFLVGVARESSATDLLTLGKEVEDLQKQLKALRHDVNSLKARLDKMKPQPDTRSEEVKTKAAETSVPPTEAQIKAARMEVCSALQKYEKQIRQYVKMRNADEMWDKMQKAYSTLESVLNKYDQYKVIQQIDQLTGDVISDIYQGRLARNSIPGNAEFRKAVDRHVKKLREIQAVCKQR